MLRRHDSSAPTVGKLYSGWFELGEFLKTTNLTYKDHVIDKHEARWAYGHSAIAAAAYVVDPEYHDHEQQDNEEVMEGFLDVTEKIGILLEVRRVMEERKYPEMWEKRASLIATDPAKQRGFESYPSDYPTTDTERVCDFCKTVNAQLAMYRGKKGVFSRKWVMDSAESMPAYMWWDSNGSSVPELQSVARMVLAQPGSASICERINSEFAFVKDKRRNRLRHHRADKLVALFHNLRLVYRMKKPAYEEPAVAWTDANNPDESGIFKYGVAHYSAPTMKAILKPNRPVALLEPSESVDEEDLGP